MNKSNIDSPITVLTAILLGVVGLSMPNISPIFLGAAADNLQFSYEQIGLLGGIEILGISVAAVSAVLWVHRISWRAATYFGLLICVSGNLLSAQVESFHSLVVLRAVIGLFGEGVVFSIGVSGLGRTRNPDRSYALMVTGQVAWMMAGMLALPYAQQLWGVAGIVIPVAVAIALVLPLVHSLPARAGSEPVSAASDNAGNAPVIWLVMAQFTWYIGALSIFAFIERIGNNAGFEGTEIGLVLAIGMGMSLLGSLVASLQGDRFGRLLPFLLTMALQAGFAVLLIDVQALKIYALAWIVINTVWNYGLPYIYAAVNAADSSGRFVVMVPAAQGFGGALGTIIAGYLVARFGLQGVVFLLLIANLLAAMLFAMGVKESRSPEPDRAENNER